MNYEELVPKPWGAELIWAKTDKYVAKFLTIHKDQSLSLQYHQIKDETIYLAAGKMEFHYDGNVEILTAGMHRHIEPKKIHRMKAIEQCIVCEVSTPELDDVVRLRDQYGRGVVDELVEESGGSHKDS